MKTLEAIVETSGVVRLVSDLKLPRRRRALVTILDEEPVENGKAATMEQLIAAFKKASEINAFRTITDPADWQRKLRDEWD